MNITLAAADIARRIPEMAKDSAVNNEGVIQRILESHMQKEQFDSCYHLPTKKQWQEHLKNSK